MLGGEGSPVVFYILSVVAFAWFFIWSIADFADANGFVMVGKNFNEDKGAAGVFGIITAIMMMLISFLAVINAVFFYKREWTMNNLNSSINEKSNDLSITFSSHISYLLTLLPLEFDSKIN